MNSRESSTIAGGVRADLFDAILNVSHMLRSSDDLRQVLGEVATSIGRAIGADLVVIGLLGDDIQALQIGGVYSSGGRSFYEPGMSVPADHFGAGAFSDAGSMLPHAAAGVAVSSGVLAGRAVVPDAFVLFPMAYRGTIRGILAVSPGPGGAGLNDVDIRFCQGIAAQIAAALDAAWSRARYECRLTQLAAQASLVQMVLEGKGLAALTTALGELLGNPVTVADGVFHLLAYSPNQDHADRHRQESLVSGGTPRSVLDDPVVRKQFHRVAQLREPLALVSFPQHGWVQRRIQAPILMGNDVLGRVTVVESERPFVESDHAVLREATVALALELMKQRAALETEHRLRADFLRDLLAGLVEDRSAIIARAGYLGIDLLRPWDLLVVEVDGAHDLALDCEESDQGVAKRRIFETVHHVVTRSCAQSVAVVHGESILVLVPSVTKAAPGIRSLADAIRREITRVSLQATVSVGVGVTCHQLEDFSRSYAQAKRALDVVRSLGQSDTVTSLDDLGVYGMLFQSEDRGELAHFADRMLGPVLQYDRKHGSDLVKTLDAFFEENGNHRRTAARLFIHINTLSGRLERIAATANVDLDDATTRLNLQLALRILRLTGRCRFRA